MRKPLIAGNWKMYKSLAEARALAKNLKEKLATVQDCEIVVCPAYTALGGVVDELKGSAIGVGAQNVHWEKQGAFTGEISAGMLLEIGCRYAIVGHSERRQYFGETDDTVNKRALAALAAGLIPIICVGESLKEREGNITFTVIENQMAGSLKNIPAGALVVIAYEPVWAIGTGKTASPVQAQEVHAYIREQFGKMYSSSYAASTRILYGGSVKPDNMSALMEQPDIDGGLVGGASLEVESFSTIVRYGV